MSEVDVSKCAFYYDNGKCNNPNGMACNCANVAYCYFKHIQRLKKQNQDLKNVTKCHHLVLDECSLTGKNCKGLQVCFGKAEQKLEKIKEIADKTCASRCRCIDKTDILQIIEGE